MKIDLLHNFRHSLWAEWCFHRKSKSFYPGTPLHLFVSPVNPCNSCDKVLKVSEGDRILCLLVCISIIEERCNSVQLLGSI